MTLQRILDAWNALTPRLRLATLGGVAIIAIAGIVLLAGGGRPCGERADVEARVADISSRLQADAAAGKIAITELSARVKKLNGAATAFETSKDLPAFCAALDSLSDEFATER